MLDTKPDTRLEATHQGTWRQPHSAPQPCGARPDRYRTLADEEPQAHGQGTAAWVVAQTHPQAERWASTELARRGYRTYLPLLAVQRRDRATHRMMHTVLVPLFPGYLFVDLSPADPWSPVRNAPGVAALLMMGGRPNQVPKGLVEAIQAGDESRRSVNAPASNWAPGTPCKLVAGAFDGHDAVVTKLLARGVRVAVLCFGALQEITVPQHWLEVR